MAAPFVSVIIPAFNAGDFIADAVQSALSQNGIEVEAIVIDDCSTDDTVGRVRLLATEEPRVRLVEMAQNSGPASARNAGIEAARGDWVAVLDSDDVFAGETVLAAMAEFAEARKADFVSANMTIRNADGSEELLDVADDFEAGEALTVPVFLEGNLPRGQGSRRGLGFLKPMMRKAFLTGADVRYRDGVRFAEDFDLYLRALISGAKWALWPQSGYCYRVRGDSLTANHSTADLRKLREMARAALETWPAPASAAGQGRTIRRRYLNSVDKRLYWREFIDGWKARDLGALGRAYTVSLPVATEISGKLAQTFALRLRARLGGGE